MTINTIDMGDPKNFISTISEVLARVEVKGDSVEYIFKARMMLKELYESIKEKEEEEV